MHKLGRSVRFSVNPFLAHESLGSNSYASKPAGEGLALFFELWVELEGAVGKSTGFIVNVTEIDEKVRRFVVPVFTSQVKNEFRAGRHIGFARLGDLLRSAWDSLEGEFAQAKLTMLALKLSPFRKLAMDTKDSKKIHFSERFEFAATHKLWNDEFSEQKNFEVFGKCANPDGHGHNYVVEVTVEIDANSDFCMADYEKVVSDELIEIVDHKNLNTEVGDFARVIPTVENIATFAWGRLAGKFEIGMLHKVTVWETDKTYSSYSG